MAYIQSCDNCGGVVTNANKREMLEFLKKLSNKVDALIRDVAFDTKHFDTESCIIDYVSKGVITNREGMF